MGKTWVQGRLVRTQTTTRPPSVDTEVWRTLSKKQKWRAKQQWAKLEPMIIKAREDRGIPKHVPTEDTEYVKALAKARAALECADATSMPTVALTALPKRAKFIDTGCGCVGVWCTPPSADKALPVGLPADSSISQDANEGNCTIRNHQAHTSPPHAYCGRVLGTCSQADPDGPSHEDRKG